MAAINFSIATSLEIAQTLTVSSLASSLLRVTSAGVVSTTSLSSALALSAGGELSLTGSLASSGLTMSTARLLGRTTASSGAVEEITVDATNGNILLAAGALTLDSTLAGINSVTSAAATALTLGTASFGTALTLASANGAATFAAGAAFAGALSGITTLAASGVVTLSNATASTSTGTGALVVSGGIGAAGNVHSGGNFYSVDAGALLFGAGTTYVQGNSSTSTINLVTGSTIRAQLTSASLTLTATTASSSTTTGALIVAGGVGIAGAVYAGADLSLNNQLLLGNTETEYDTTRTQPVIYSTASTGTAPFNEAGHLVISPRISGASRNIYFHTGYGATLTISGGGTVTAHATTSSTSTTTGALVVSGGVGVAGAAYIGGLLSVTGTINALTINATTGAMTLGSASSITAASATNLTLAGGSSGASLVLGQGTNGGATLTAQGTGLFTLANDAAWLRLGTVTGAKTYHISGVQAGGAIQIQQNSGATTRWIAFGKVDNAFAWTEQARIGDAGNLLIGGTTEISGSGGLKVFGTTASTSTASGAFICAGGVGIAGALNVGATGVSLTHNITGGDGGVTTALLQLKEAVAGATVLRVNGTGNVILSVTTEATTAGAGSLTTSGGIYATKAIITASTTASTSTTTGALICSGGVGIAGNTYIGGNGVVTGDLTVTGGNVGVGTAPDSAVGVYLLSSALAGTTQYGLFCQPAFTSAATNNARNIYVVTQTAAASFTVTNGTGIMVATPSLGAGSAITTQTGLSILNQGAAGITNAYGIDIAAQSSASSTNVGLRNAGTTLLTNATAATELTSNTGALQVSGGANVAKELVVGAGSSNTYTIWAGGAGGSGFTGVGGGTFARIQGFTTGFATTTLQLQNSGGALSIGNSASVVTINGTTASTSTTTGALVVSGGVGVAGALYVGGVMVGSSTLTTSDTIQINNSTAASVVLNQTGTRQWTLSAASGGLSISAGSTGTFTFASSALVAIATTTEATTGGAGALVVSGGIYATKKIITLTDFECAASANGVILLSPGGTRYRITVDNAGALTTTAL